MAGGVARLNHAVDSYLAVRRAAGFELRVSESLLRLFAAFASRRGETHVQAQSAVAWAAEAPSPYQRKWRLQVVRIFARHAHAEDERHEIPPGNVFCPRRQPYVPFRFSLEQVHQLLQQAARLTPTGSLRPWTYTTLLSLLAVTGLRISEALALRFSDVTPDGLQIRETKFRKSRLVPLHPSTSVGLDRYLQRRRRVGGADDHVFISLRGGALRYPTVNATFRALIRDGGFPLGLGGSRPRVHDLRHHFAARVLQACPCDRQRASQHMLALATYMGHARLASTYWYLHATPHLLEDIADACERFLKGDRS